METLYSSLAFSHSLTSIPVRTLLFFFSGGDHEGGPPLPQFREMSCLFWEHCKMSATKILGMSLIQGKHWGHPLLLWESECWLELLWSKPSQLATSSQSNGQLNSRNYVCAQNCVHEGLCLFFHKHFTGSLKFSGASVIVQHLAYA